MSNYRCVQAEDPALQAVIVKAIGAIEAIDNLYWQEPERFPTHVVCYAGQLAARFLYTMVGRHSSQRKIPPGGQFDF